jgi:hypothetical protein
MTIVLTDMRDRAIRALHLKKIAETSAGQPPPDPPVSATGTDDPLFVVVEKLLRSMAKDPQPREPLTHKDGRFGSQLTVILGKPVPLTPEEMRLAAVYGILDLGTNLSLYGRGIAFAATELQARLREIIALLNDPEIKASYGARDMFQVVARVATLELGGARNSIRYRTMANAGAVIIRWLANRASILSSSSSARLLNDFLIQSRQTSPTKPTLDPTDFDLVNACGQWLVATGTPENTR